MRNGAAASPTTLCISASLAAAAEGRKEVRKAGKTKEANIAAHDNCDEAACDVGAIRRPLAYCNKSGRS